MAICSSILAWRIPWTEELGRLYSPWGCKESDMTEHTIQIDRQINRWIDKQTDRQIDRQTDIQIPSLCRDQSCIKSSFNPMVLNWVWIQLPGNIFQRLETLSCHHRGQGMLCIRQRRGMFINTLPFIRQSPPTPRIIQRQMVIAPKLRNPELTWSP